MASAPSITTALPERIADRYSVLSELGRGGMAVALRVLDTATGREVALKQLLAPQNKAEIVELFEREFHTLTQLAHPRIVQAFDYGVEEHAGQPCPYYTMELLDGGDLAGLAPLPWQRVCQVAYEVCAALSFLHARRLVHRDLTPRNVRLTADGEAKLIDFGLLAPFGAATLLAGTPPYVAPELVNSMQLDGRSDLFSLGALMYHALTGRVAFPARRFDQLRDLWRGPPVPIQRFVDDVPEPLQTLVMALLRVDVVSRPKSAAEVMDRLRPLLPEPPGEDLAAASAYLVAPRLIGRDAQVTRIRKQMVRALRGRGGGFLIVGSAGHGRTRVLDAFVLEAKLMGAVTARIGAGEGAEGPYGGAQSLLDQLVTGAGLAALQAAQADPRCWQVLFDDARAEPPGAEPPRPTRLTSLDTDRGELQALLRGFVSRLSRARTVALAVDDYEQLDEPSRALFAALALTAADCRIAYALATQAAALAAPDQTLSVVQQAARELSIEPLPEAEVEQLILSVFGDEPNLSALSHLLYTTYGGVPRDLMAAAQHLVDAGVVKYQGGRWLLPGHGECQAALPTREDGLHRTVCDLSPDAAQIGLLLALSAKGHLRRGDLLQMQELDRSAVDTAIDALRDRQLLVGGPSGYTLANQRVRTCLLERCDPARIASTHDLLASHYRALGETETLVAYHGLQGTTPERALDALVAAFLDLDARVAILTADQRTLGQAIVARVITMAGQLAEAKGRCERERFVFWSSAAGLAAGVGDAQLYYANPPEYLDCMKRCSGYHEWQALSEVEDPATRSLQAVTAAQARHDGLPDPGSQITPTEAIQSLVGYAVFSIAIGRRTANAPLVESLPDLLVPFRPFSPLIAAIERNARATRAQMRGCRELARDEFAALYEDLKDIDEHLEMVERMQAAVALAVATDEASMGIVPEARWLTTDDPNQVVSMEYIKKVVALHRGDWDAAEAHRRKAEVMALERDAASMLSTLYEELEVHALARELTGLSAVRTRIHAEAESDRRWRSTAHLADAFYYQLCGDWDAALAAVAAVYADRTGPPRLRHQAAVAEVDVLREQGQASRALQVGKDAHAAALADNNRHVARSLALALALAEVEAGELESARQRVQQVIAEQDALGVSGLLRGKSAECLARIELAAGDGNAFHRAAAETAQHYRPGESAVLGALYARLVERGQDSTDPAAILEEPATQVSSQVGLSLMSCSDGRSRAMEALRMLCDEAVPRHGYLFLLGHDGLTLHASNRRSADPEGLARHAMAQLELELDDDTCTAVITPGEEMHQESEGRHWCEDETRFFSVPLLAHSSGDTLVVGIAVISDTGEPIQRVRTLAMAVASHLLSSGDYLAKTAG